MNLPPIQVLKNVCQEGPEKKSERISVWFSIRVISWFPLCRSWSLSSLGSGQGTLLCSGACFHGTCPCLASWEPYAKTQFPREICYSPRKALGEETYYIKKNRYTSSLWNILRLFKRQSRNSPEENYGIKEEERPSSFSLQSASLMCCLCNRVKADILF